MEKLLYPVWKYESDEPDDFRDTLLDRLSPELVGLDIDGLRISAVDSDVADAAGLRQENSQPPMDGLISVWIESAVFRQPVEAAIARHVARTAGYLVTESAPLVADTPEGERTPGMAQVVFLQRPPRLSEAQWLEIWQGSHTHVAIETQSTFGYRQNAIVRPMTYAAPPYDAVIEENFPPEAMTSQHAFYGVDTDEELQENLKAMIDSCQRFIDFEKMDVIPMSEYLIKSAFTA